MALYGDGTTDLVVPPGGLSLDNNAGFDAFAGDRHLQFRNITVSGPLVLPSGTRLRATGNVVINNWITVTRGARDSGGGAPHPGISAAAAGGISGGIGLEKMQAMMLQPLPQFGGGAGERTPALPDAGRGGGAVMIAAGGNIIISGTGSGIGASGEKGARASGGIDAGGGGGGAGGLVILAAKGSVTMTDDAIILARGGDGGAGWNGVTGDGTGAAGGGGGGGGVIHIVAGSIAIPFGYQLQVDAGVAGSAVLEGTTTLEGSGGGASGGHGGNGGSGTGAASAGQAGKAFKTLLISPETFLSP